MLNKFKLLFLLFILSCSQEVNDPSIQTADGFSISIDAGQRIKKDVVDTSDTEEINENDTAVEDTEEIVEEDTTEITEEQDIQTPDTEEDGTTC